MRVQNIPNRKHIQKLLQIPGKAGVESQPNQPVNGYCSTLTCLETPPGSRPTTHIPPGLATLAIGIRIAPSAARNCGLSADHGGDKGKNEN